MLTRHRLSITLVIFVLIMALGISAVAQKGEEVEVKARVRGHILIEVKSGDEITFEVDPIDNPEDTASTELLVKTNARRYTIVATIGDFNIGDYDLIQNEKFSVRSKAPGSGRDIGSWEVPQRGELTILQGEDGRTTGELTVVEYKLQVDFSVPPGEGTLVIAYTAMAAF